MANQHCHLTDCSHPHQCSCKTPLHWKTVRIIYFGCHLMPHYNTLVLRWMSTPVMYCSSMVGLCLMVWTFLGILGSREWWLCHTLLTLSWYKSYYSLIMCIYGMYASFSWIFQVIAFYIPWFLFMAFHKDVSSWNSFGTLSSPPPRFIVQGIPWKCVTME